MVHNALRLKNTALSQADFEAVVYLLLLDYVSLIFNIFSLDIANSQEKFTSILTFSSVDVV